MRVLTAAEIRGLESCAVESGVSMETLMENAGAEVAAAVTEKMDVTGKKTVILCGKGNNGGDGWVAGEYLDRWGALIGGRGRKGDGRFDAGRTGLRPCKAGV